MAPKNKDQKAAEKAKDKAKEKIAVDKTFGLKNKKGASVQKFVKNILQNSKPEHKRNQPNEHVERKNKDKELQQTALLNSLFNMATDKKGKCYSASAKKAAKEKVFEEEKAGKGLSEEIQNHLKQGIYNAIQMMNPKGVYISELGGSPYVNQAKETYEKELKGVQLLAFIKWKNDVFWLDDEDSTNPKVRCMDDVHVEEGADERPLEEIIEEQRRNLPSGGTPVTLETFTAWKQKKEAERLDKVEADRQEATKKTGGKGLVGLSGRDLFLYDQSIFVDDKDADEEKYEVVSQSDEEEKVSAVAEGDEEIEEEEEPHPKAPEEASAVKSAEIFNKDVFLAGGDVPDDLDDLDDDDDDNNDDNDDNDDNNDEPEQN